MIELYGIPGEVYTIQCESESEFGFIKEKPWIQLFQEEKRGPFFSQGVQSFLMFLIGNAPVTLNYNLFLSYQS